MRHSVGASIQVTATYVRDESKLKFSVIDTGVGISQDDQQNLFKLYCKLSSREKSKIGGPGMGLYICKQILSYYEGDIWCESELEQGAKFHFTMSAQCPNGGLSAVIE